MTMDFEHKLVLDQQVSELHGFRNEETEMATTEAALMRQQWDLEREEAKKVEAMRHNVLMKANDELHEFNQHKRMQLAESVAAERKADAERLAAQLALEAHENEREAAARESMQHETRRFAEHMMQQKRAIAMQEGEQEIARKAEQDKAWDKRLAVWGREQEARENLMAQVLEERKIQVEVKLEQEKIDKVRSAHARSQLNEELGRINVIEAVKDQEAKQVRLEHQALLSNQIKDKSFQKAASQYNKMQERMGSERAEAQYQAMLREQMDKTMSNMDMFSQATKFSSN